jgi:hypothetical protein
MGKHSNKKIHRRRLRFFPARHALQLLLVYLVGLLDIDPPRALCTVVETMPSLYLRSTRTDKTHMLQANDNVHLLYICPGIRQQRQAPAPHTLPDLGHSAGDTEQDQLAIPADWQVAGIEEQLELVSHGVFSRIQARPVYIGDSR